MARCVQPVYVRLDNGGHVWAPCGSCIECLQRKQQDMTFRILSELRNAKTAYFVTLTYADEHLPVDGKLKKKHLQSYIKRVRRDNKLELKYYAIGEYGDKFNRPHYHAIMFNVKDVNVLAEKWADYDEKNRRKGPLGFVKIGTVNLLSVQYVTKYFIKRKEEDCPPPKDGGLFSLSSKNLGINYLRENWKWHKEGTKSYVIGPRGKEQAMPRYYADKVFNFREKQKIQEDNIKREIDQYWNNVKSFGSESAYLRDMYPNRDQKLAKIERKLKQRKLKRS